MDQTALQAALKDLPLGPIRYYDRLGSTNDEAARWAEEGAPDLSLVVADEQTAGRGRLNRHWYTPHGSALAFSLVLRPERHGSVGSGLLAERALSSSDKKILGQTPIEFLPRLSALGALAVHKALQKEYGLSPQIKWPNDVLVERKKLAGVLAESAWDGEQLAGVVLGIGVNVALPSVPPEGKLTFPATCVEAILGRQVDRWELLKAILAALLEWRSRLQTQEFWHTWDQALAFRGEKVHLHFEGGEPLEGQLLGLDPEGALRLETPDGEVRTLQIGEVRLRPVDSSPRSDKLDLER